MGAGFAIASAAVPFSLTPIPTASIRLLASMHLLTGAIFVVAMLPALPRDTSTENASRAPFLPSVPV